MIPILVLAVGAAACAREPSGQSTEGAEDASEPVDVNTAAPGDTPVPLEEWLRGALAAARLDRDALRAELGAPTRTTLHTQANRHDPAQTDSIAELGYADARFVYYVVTAGGNDLLDFAEVRSNRHLALTPPGIGTPADSLRAWWGAPLVTTDSTLEYDCATCEVPHPATFVIEDGRVRAIRFDLYVD